MKIKGKAEKASNQGVVPTLRFPEFKGDWVSKKGDEITTKITKGSSPNWQGFSYQSEGILFITSENVRDGFLDVSNPKYLPEKFYEKQKNSQLSYGDILINIVGASIGRNCMYLLDCKAFTNQAVALFRADNKNSFEFVNYCCQHDRIQNAIIGSQSESARPNLSLTDLRNMEFVLPSLPEQQKIADCLSSLDELIAAQAHKLDTLKSHKKGLMQQLFPAPGQTTPTLRFPEFQDAGDWEERPLESICGMQAGKFVSASKINEKFEAGLYPCYGGNGLRGFTKTHTHTGKYPLIGRQGALCGNIFFAKEKFHATEHAIVATPFKGIDITWLYYLLVHLNLNQYATGQAQPGLSVDILKKITTIIPAKEKEQKKTANCLSSLDELIAAQAQKLDTLKAHKKGLMQQLFPNPDEAAE